MPAGKLVCLSWFLRRRRVLLVQAKEQSKTAAKTMEMEKAITKKVAKLEAKVEAEMERFGKAQEEMLAMLKELAERPAPAPAPAPVPAAQ